MNRAYLVDGVRTPIGRYAGSLSSVRPDDLAAHVLRELVADNCGFATAVLDVQSRLLKMPAAPQTPR